uniref:Uncharacterized protein n=1 Tax=Sipha flava TaxID=143950 RepID=A0A2S2Q5Q2_9HEMI
MFRFRHHCLKDAFYRGTRVSVHSHVRQSDGDKILPSRVSRVRGGNVRDEVRTYPRTTSCARSTLRTDFSSPSVDFFRNRYELINRYIFSVTGAERPLGFFFFYLDPPLHPSVTLRVRSLYDGRIVAVVARHSYRRNFPVYRALACRKRIDGLMDFLGRNR